MERAYCAVYAGNAIEDVVAPRKRIEALVEQKTTPRNRSEAEIAGYRAVLDLIHEQARDIPFRPSVVEQLHRDLYQYTAVPAGRWKTTENAIEEGLSDGTKRVRFRTVAAAETPAAMDELHVLLHRARGGTPRGSRTSWEFSSPPTASSRIGSGCSAMAAGRKRRPSSASFETASPTSSPSRMSARPRSEPAIPSLARCSPASATRA